MRIISIFFLILLCFIGEGCKDEEREALLQIKSSLNSPEERDFSTWYGEDCCQWEGVECNVSTSQIIKIVFPYAVSGEEEWYPDATSFTQFKDLQELHLSWNRIAGFISPNAFHKLERLHKLNLRGNLISHTSHLCWGNIPTLLHLDLSRNSLQGPIPQCLCESQSLTKLFLSYNSLTGNIDWCFSKMTSLQHLFLSGNLFSGKFQNLLFQNLSNIQSFVISQNNFTDVIPFSIFANLSKLSNLDLSFNPELEIETESPSWSPSFSLKQLKLGGCILNKRSGRNIPGFLSTQYYLESLDLSYNGLVGRFPSWLLYNIASELWIRGNNLSGSFSISQGNGSRQLATLDISDNMLYGPLPEDINFVFPKLRRLNASHNMFNSTIPQSFGEMGKLQFLDLSSNNLRGEVPHGIFSNLTYLEFLKLSSNELRGEVVGRNFSLARLRWLDLERNGFTGSFPAPLSNCPNLKLVSIAHNDFSGELSRSFPVLPQLRWLILKGNRLRGGIPKQICQMQHMRVLDLSENDFSGQIPTCLNNVTSLKEGYAADHVEPNSQVTFNLTMRGTAYMYTHYLLEYIFAIDISCNKLTGVIPVQMTELARILSLNMSHNLLTGPIPESFANLQQVESLDFSCNNLSGNLPRNLTHLVFLSTFNVSFNNLSGPLVPLENQFSTFENSSYMGNLNLCGPPLSKNCNKLQTWTADKSQGKINEKTCIQLVIGFILFYLFFLLC